MRTAVVTLLSLVGLALLGAAAFVYAGFFNVGADDPHSPLVHAVLETARMRSIQTRAARIVVPAGYDTEENVVSAAGHFAEHCATCHGTPANKPDAFAEGMYPRPPSLTRASEKYTPAELFWIMKHGIKMSGMPAMADDGDPMLWSTVAFVQRFPHLNGEGFNDLWGKAQAQSGKGHDMGKGGVAVPMPGSDASTAGHGHAK